jgi:hypothetical protein
MTFKPALTANSAHIEECNEAFGVSDVSDCEDTLNLEMASESVSTISDDSRPGESVPYSPSTEDTSVSEDFGSMPGLQTVSDSSEAFSDQMDVDDGVDLFSDVSDGDLLNPEDVEDVDWSTVRAFMELKLDGEAHALEEPVCVSPRIELLDSGCTCHISPYKDDFVLLKDVPPKPFRAANKQRFCATGEGELTIEMPNGAVPSQLHLSEVLYSPEVGYTLISVGKLDDLGFDIRFRDGACTIRAPDGTQVARVPKDSSGLYRVSHNEDSAHAVEVITVDQLHRRMGHIAPETASKMVRKGFVTGVKLSVDSGTPTFCESCIYAKATRKLVPKEREGEQAGELGGEVHSDVWGPAPVSTLRGRRYYVSFIDDKTRLAHITLLTSKSEVFQAYKDFEAHLRTQFDKSILAMNTDRGGEYIAQSFVTHLKAAGTRQKLNVHDTPQHAGVSERFNQTVIERTRAMLHASGLSRFLWGEAVHHAVWLFNRSPTKALNGMTPLEAATGTKPDIAGLREWGEKVWVRVEKGNKLGGCVQEGRWVGFAANSKGSRIYWPQTRKVTVERNVYTRKDDAPMDRFEGEDWIFEPDTAPPQPEENIADAPAPTTLQNDPIIHEPSTSTSIVPPNEVPQLPKSRRNNIDSLSETNILPEGSKRTKRPSSRVLDLISGKAHTSSKPADPILPTGVQFSSPTTEIVDAEDDEWTLLVDDQFLEEYALALETADAEVIEPRTLTEAKSRPDWLLWEKGIYEELDTLQAAGTWELVEKRMLSVQSGSSGQKRTLQETWLDTRHASSHKAFRRYLASTISIPMPLWPKWL